MTYPTHYVMPRVQNKHGLKSGAHEEVTIDPMHYSTLSATSGSTFVARRAGT